MIIDVHSHLGWDTVFDEDFTLIDQFEKHSIYKIDKTILQPGTCHDLDTVFNQHNAIAVAVNNNPDSFYGLANLNPHLKAFVYEEEIRRCIEDLGFVGIKLHTFAHAVNPGGKDGRRVFDLARKYSVPVMVHTGSGIPFSNPSALIPIGLDYPDVKIIMAHCGMMVLAAETPIAMKLCPNIYADTSWSAGFAIRHWIEEFGANRFMLGSDHADNMGTELKKLKTCGLNSKQLEWVLHKTAEIVFGIK